METVKVSSKGQVVIPKSLRDSHRIHTGDSFIITAVGDELHLKPAPTVQQTNLKSVAGMLYQPGGRKLSDKQLEQRISSRLRAEDEAGDALHLAMSNGDEAFATFDARLAKRAERSGVVPTIELL